LGAVGKILLYPIDSHGFLSYIVNKTVKTLL